MCVYLQYVSLCRGSFFCLCMRVFVCRGCINMYSCGIVCVTCVCLYVWNLISNLLYRSIWKKNNCYSFTFSFIKFQLFMFKSSTDFDDFFRTVNMCSCRGQNWENFQWGGGGLLGGGQIWRAKRAENFSTPPPPWRHYFGGWGQFFPQ